MGRPQDEFNLEMTAGSARQWRDHVYCEWASVIGDRVRRLRRERNLTLGELGRAISKPGGGGYSHGHLSKVERGWAVAPLYLYLGTAYVLEVDPGVMLGPHAVNWPVSESEHTLLRVLRELGIEPHEAIARLAAPREGFEPPT